MIKVYPSILGIDEIKFDNIFKILNKFDCYKKLHLDIMDGKYVQNTSFSPKTVKLVKENTNRPIDVHLMTYDITKHIVEYINNGVDQIIIHLDSLDENTNFGMLFTYTRVRNCKLGLALKPNEEVESIGEFLPFVSSVLVMSVEPGKGGQKFIDSILSKISYLSEIRRVNKLKFEITVDGGINIENAKRCIDVGADSFVVGSALFKGDLEENIAKFE